MSFSFDIQSLRRAYQEGRAPGAVIAEVYRRIAQVNDPGIFIHLIPQDEAVAAAQALPPFDPTKHTLWGVPFAVKDNIDVAGVPTTAACPAFAYTPKRDATVVARLRDAGAILIGKTNLDQFATGLVGVRTPWPIPRNAMDPSLVPGGSSSGSGVSVAHGVVSFALGTDTAGSGRVPAALNNVVGLKPSLGLLSNTGVVPACRTLDCVSIFAGCVDDAWSVLAAARGHDPADAYSRTYPQMAISRPPRLRIGTPDAGARRFFDAFAEKAYEAHLELLSRIDGVEIAPVDLRPFLEAAELLYGGAWVAERYWAARDIIAERPQELLEVTRKIIGGAPAFDAVAAFEGFYQLAELRAQTALVWRSVDMFALPTIPLAVTLDDIAADPIGANSRLGVYTNFVNLLDLAALAVPGSFRSDGRPAGLTFVAPSGRDGFLAGVGRAFHAMAGVRMGGSAYAPPEPPALPPCAPPGLIELAVVGAHLSGMALNHELTNLGAVFLRAASTTKDYRLYALPGGPPKRPGLVRIADGEGAQIELEVWGLEPARFGEFVARIPEPLGVGTLRLADGTRPTGFLCEAQAARAAIDITSYGGWRAYTAAT